MKFMKIRGAGGGGGGGGSSSTAPARAAVISPDSLTSRQYAHVLDLVSEGEIEGLVNGHKSIYLDDTPLQNTDGTYNFSGFTIEARNGGQTQDHIPGFAATESAYAVSVEVRYGIPVVRTVSNTNLDAVRVNVAVPQLFYQHPTTGDISGASVDLIIEVQANGGTYQQVLADTISGKASSRYNRNYRVELAGVGPWNIRVTKVTEDSTNDTKRDLYWDTITEIIDVKLSYPNSALMGITIDSSQFSSIPSRAYDLKGLRIKVPSNYDPVTRVYSGIWDGTFKIAWSDNPAWCYYDLQTNPRYGLGEFVSEAQVDKANLYTIGKYCDEMVPDGFGGLEPRFTCNMYLQTREDAFKVLSDMAGLFAGMLFWSSGGLSCTQDSPDDAMYQFTNANVINGEFRYNGSSRNVRHTTALISYNDPTDKFARKVEYVEDTEGIAKYGIRQYESVAIGCASRGQAHRLGKRVLLTERYLTETVTFSTGLEGSIPYPGAVIQVMDNNRAGMRMGGRVRAATLTAVTLDSPVTLSPSESYTLTIIRPDGTLETRGVAWAAGELQELNLALPLSEVPNTQSVWTLASSALDPQLFKVVGIKEQDGMTFEITALAYNPTKYDAIEKDLKFEPLQVSALNWVPNTPENLDIVESLYQSGVDVKTRVDISWDHANEVTWMVVWRPENGNWMQLPSSVASMEFLDVSPGTYTIGVAAVNVMGVRGPLALRTLEIYGKIAPPVDVAGFSVIKTAGLAVPSWTLHPDLDVRVGGRIVVRHSPDVVGATWDNAYIVEEFDGNSVSGLCALMTGTYFAKAKDSIGNWSINPVSFVATEGMVTGYVTISTVQEDTTFVGAKTNLIAYSGVMVISSAGVVDDISPDIDSSGMIDAFGGTLPEGEYVFANAYDGGTSAVRRFVADLRTESYDVGDYVDQRTLNIDDWSTIDGGAINDCDITIYASTTDDDPSGSPTWSAWTPFFVADFSCRAAKFKAVLTCGSASHNIAVTRLRVAVKIPV